MNNDFVSLNIKLHNNHIFINDGQGLILDTGSPLSFHPSGVIEIGETKIPVPSYLPELSSDFLHESISDDAKGLLGMDIISKHVTMIDLRNDLFFINDDAPYLLEPFHHIHYLIGNLIGVVMQINEKDARMVVDSAAPISYIGRNYTIRQECVGVAQDFSPYCGRFETTLYECQTYADPFDVPYILRYGTPPPAVSRMLELLHVDGILGVDFFKRFRLLIKNGRLFLPQQGI